jgi:hypothetical protein
MLRRYERTALQHLSSPKTMKTPHTERTMGQKVDPCSDPSGIAKAKPAKAPPKNAPAEILLSRTLSVSLSTGIRPCSRPAMYASEGNGGALSDKSDTSFFFGLGRLARHDSAYIDPRNLDDSSGPGNWAPNTTPSMVVPGQLRADQSSSDARVARAYSQLINNQLRSAR